MRSPGWDAASCLGLSIADALASLVVYRHIHNSSRRRSRRQSAREARGHFSWKPCTRSTSLRLPSQTSSTPLPAIRTPRYAPSAHIRQDRRIIARSAPPCRVRPLCVPLPLRERVVAALRVAAGDRRPGEGSPVPPPARRSPRPRRTLPVYPRQPKIRAIREIHVPRPPKSVSSVKSVVPQRPWNVPRMQSIAIKQRHPPRARQLQSHRPHRPPAASATTSKQKIEKTLMQSKIVRRIEVDVHGRIAQLVACRRYALVTARPSSSHSGQPPSRRIAS